MKCDECTRGEGHLGQVVDLLSRVFIFLLLFLLDRPKERELLGVTNICVDNREEMDAKEFSFIKQTQHVSAMILTEMNMWSWQSPIYMRTARCCTC